LHSFAADTTGKREREKEERLWGRRYRKGNDVQCSYRWQRKEMLYSVHTDGKERKGCTNNVHGDSGAKVSERKDVQTVFVKHCSSYRLIITNFELFYFGSRRLTQITKAIEKERKKKEEKKKLIDISAMCSSGP